MKFENFFSIVTEHEFFNDRKCHDLFIQPTPGCIKILKKHGLLLSSSGDADITVLSVKNEADNAVKSLDGNAAFTFFIYLSDLLFESYTRLPQKQPDEVFCYTNMKSDKTSSYYLDQSVIKYPLKKSGDGRKLFGMIKIVTHESFSKAFILNFKAASIQWKYYLLVNGNMKNLKIDGSQADIQFQKKEGPLDSIAEAIVSSFPDANPLLYQSETEIPYQEMGRKNIRLINADNNMVLINHMPNPGLKENGIKIINTKI